MKRPLILGAQRPNLAVQRANRAVEAELAAAGLCHSIGRPTA
ncbi:hypothetical protein [Roseovarius nitratireducens]|nr:hypothetical protein [Roseovarius nitratireducens]